jgi:NADH:ubiquinone oxidoreductase subunit 3 (subunit A)
MTWDILLLIFWLFMLAAVAAGLAVWNIFLGYINSTSDHISTASSSKPYTSDSTWVGYDYHSGSSYTSTSTLSISGPSTGRSSTQVPATVSAVLDNARTVLIVAVVLAAIQVVSLVVTAALSSATRNALRLEAHGDVLPMSAPKPVLGMYAGKPVQFTSSGHVMKDVPAKPIVGGYNQHRRY